MSVFDNTETEFDRLVPPGLTNLAIGAPPEVMLKKCTDALVVATQHRMVRGGPKEGGVLGPL